MKTKNPKPIHCFKPGTHITMAGEAIEFSAADVESISASYNPNKYRAPLVIGHPKDDGPAFGSVVALTSEPRGLFATPGDDVDPAFAMQVGPHGLNAVSIKLFRPDAPNNPTPGSWSLRHLGFLGQQSPAVKGLDGPEFADDGCVCFQESVEFGDWDDKTIAGLFRSAREWIISKFGMEEADRALPAWDVDQLQNSAAQPEEDSSAVTAFAATTHEGDEMSAEDKARLAELEAENAALKKKEAEFAEAENKRKAEARHAENVAFAEGLVNEGRLLPAHKDMTVATLDFMAGQESVVEFGEGDAKQSLLDAHKAYLAAQPKQVEFAELAGAGKGDAIDANDAAAVAEKAVEFQEAEARAGRVVSVTAAVAHVTKGKK